MTFTATINNMDINGTQTPADTNDNLTAAHIPCGRLSHAGHQRTGGLGLLRQPVQ